MAAPHRRNYFDAAREPELVALYRDGLGMDEIGRRVGCCRHTVRNVLRRLGLHTQRIRFGHAAPVAPPPDPKPAPVDDRLLDGFAPLPAFHPRALAALAAAARLTL